MKAQGSIVAVAMVLVIALGIMLATYVTMMNKMISAFSVMQSYTISTRLREHERLDLSLNSYIVVVQDHKTIFALDMDISNVGTVSTSIYKALAVCLNSLYEVRAIYILSLAKPIALQPGASYDLRLDGFVDASCYAITIVLITIYGNSYEVTLS